MRTPPRRSAGYGVASKGWKWTGSAQWRPHDLRHVAACWMLFDLHLDPAIGADKRGHADPSSGSSLAAFGNLYPGGLDADSPEETSS